MNAWSQLPNAALIDWVIESMKDRPEVWGAAWTNTARNMAWDAARDAAWTAALDAARDAAWTAALDAAWTAAWDAAWHVLAALVAYDDCDQYLQMTYEQLHAWTILSETPQAVLLLPLKWIQEHECLVTTA